MAELSESNSPNTLPICLAACNDGESCGLNDTLCASATVSNCGTKTLVTTARPSQNRAIGTENFRMRSGIR